MIQECDHLGVSVVLGLVNASHEGVFFISIDQIGPAVTDDTGATGVDKSLDSSGLCNLDEVLGSFDVDLVHDFLGRIETRAGSVNDDVWLQLSKELGHDGLIREVTKVVVASIDGFSRCSKVNG